MSFTRNTWVLGATAATLVAAGAAHARPSSGAGRAGTAILDQERLEANNWGMDITNYGSFGFDIEGGNAGGEFPRGSGWHILFAGGFQFGTLYPEVSGSDTTWVPSVSQVEFSSEYRPGAILNSGVHPTELIADDWASEDNRIYIANRGEDAGFPGGTVIGDQDSWAVFNDLDPSVHEPENPRVLGIEVQQTTHAFKGAAGSDGSGCVQGGPLGDIVFFRFKLINKSNIDYRDSYAEVWFDPDVGDAGNDLIGTDRDLSMGFAYSADDEEFNAAFGADFFQGPIVDSPGDTVVVRGSVKFTKTPEIALLPTDQLIPDKKILGLTALSHYINGTDPDRDEQRYNLMKGLTREGTERDTLTALDGFDFPGDPLTETLRVDSAPNDKRMALITGPFTLAAGDTQEVVVACIGALGADHLDAVAQLRRTDEVAQGTYIADFAVQVPPPAPVTHAIPDDGKVVLTWDSSPESFEDNFGSKAGLGAVRIDTLGFTEVVTGRDSLGNAIIDTVYETTVSGYEAIDFQGYRVYRSDTGLPGSWSLLAEYDKADGITEIADVKFNSEIFQNQVTQCHVGDDTGLKYYFVDTDVVNGMTYYYAVTAYDYQPNPALTRTLESPQSDNVLRVVPQAPPAGVSYADASVDTNIVHVGGSDGTVAVQIVDRKAVTGHDYQVSFDENSAWYLIDVTETDTLLAAQTSQDGSFSSEVRDGLAVAVSNPPFHPKDWEATGTRWWSGVNWGGALFFGGLDFGHYFFGSELDPADVHTVEIRFSDDPAEQTNCQTYRRDLGYAAAGIGIFPGSAWDMDADPPRRLNICFVEYDYPEKPANLLWDPGSLDKDGVDATREYLFIMNSDYVEDPTTLYDDENPGYAADVIYGYWPTLRGDHPYMEDPHATWTIIPNRINTPKDVFSFSTTAGAGFDQLQAKADLKKIRVTPNPYYGFSYPNETSQFSRKVKFLNLPEKCTIRIFNVAGQLVRTIEHDGSAGEGDSGGGSSIAEWDLQNESGVWVASGIYVAHIDAGTIGTTFVKFAIIQGSEQLQIF